MIFYIEEWESHPGIYDLYWGGVKVSQGISYLRLMHDIGTRIELGGPLRIGHDPILLGFES